MAHLLERNHGERFAKLMDSLMPDWRTRRDALNARHSLTKRGNSKGGCREIGYRAVHGHSSTAAG